MRAVQPAILAAVIGALAAAAVPAAAQDSGAGVGLAGGPGNNVVTEAADGIEISAVEVRVTGSTGDAASDASIGSAARAALRITSGERWNTLLGDLALVPVRAIPGVASASARIVGAMGEDASTLVVTVLLLAATATFLKKTRMGIEMRAAAVDFQMARLLGIRANRVIAVAFALSGLLASAAAILYVAQTGVVEPRLGLHLALIGFVATVVGGMGSLPGAVLGGLAVGMATVFLQVLLPAELRPYREAFVYLSVILILVLRPQGLFRSASARERV
ncbi:branched-chain amino acid ABC transporter permease [Limnoraphis robusta CCNP1315]|uniref:Branched-chain amino acid ABC transporter permease n=1 Tax=Limnoraphis robusta CCNP1315 TaxID=3110306 RepID=A0ABU5U4V4_9CYAN|nr:branched-chain amino acid ABC transporter permease [Limnoraphis robusta]MEA5522221.1 branched-chain amino acid ABC transporter permease [Limnoraphis robusta CCNP1315]